jgi:hypothetical protein
MNRWLIILGAILLLAGLLWPWIFQGLRFLWGLPGNIVIRREHFTIYLPITLCIIISIVLTLIFMLLRGRGK